ncbi:hypothetical protein I7I51_02255 [Histoplasma capsulatum]|uniref:Uncharacterized protein n=1 Tax=Ajellomyces capsulatus TaxID=5037 RepID=A0A8A1M7N3_AJECA|nr:predicted protein [Histoplasma mississippiense (nom. inval.)]EDN09719.1 predicted protein [Histoplasma mississippiense (nom. inval.)]QSS62518.1 hypothetical protein I7I51_02255 [Histoplasma capsulatum]
MAKAPIDDPALTLEQISVLENELQKMDILKELADLLHLVLIVNSGERSSAIHVRALKEFVAFSKAIRSFQASAQASKSYWRGSAPPGVQIGHLIPICGGILLFK